MNFGKEEIEKMISEIDECEQNIKNLHERIDKLERRKQICKEAQKLREMYESFISVGFSEEQACALIDAINQGGN